MYILNRDTQSIRPKDISTYLILALTSRWQCCNEGQMQYSGLCEVIGASLYINCLLSKNHEQHV